MKPTEEQIKDWGARVSEIEFEGTNVHVRGNHLYDTWQDYELIVGGVTFEYGVELKPSGLVPILRSVKGRGFHCSLPVQKDSPVWDRMEELISSIEEDEKEAKFQKEAEMSYLIQEAEKAALASMEEILGKK